MDEETRALIERVAASRCTVVDAPAGYGKSHLLRAVEAELGPGRWISHPDDLADSGDSQATMLLLDSTSHIDSVVLNDCIERALRSPRTQRIIVAGRGLSTSTRQIGSREGNCLIEATDLALSEADIHRLLTVQSTPAGVTDAAAGSISDISMGWPLLATNLIETVAKTGLDGLAQVDQSSATVAALLAPTLEQLSPGDRYTITQLALLPWLDDNLLIALGAGDLIQKQIRLGLPVVRHPDGTQRLPSAVRGYLGADGRLDGEVVRRSTPALVSRGQAMEAARLLFRAISPAAASEFLAGLPATVIDGLDADDLASLLELLEDEAERWPNLLLLRASVEAGRVRLETQRQLLERAAAATSGVDVDRIRGEARAELLFVDALAGTYSDEARSRLEEEMAAGTDGDNSRRQIRLGEALGILLASHEAYEALEEASLLLDRAARLWEHIGERKRASSTLRLLSMQTLIPLGRYVEAEAAMTRADELGHGTTGERARNIVVRARAAALAGRPEVDQYLDVADELARTIRRPWIAAYTDWSRMLAAETGRKGALHVSLHEHAWSQLGELQNHSTGLIFLCESAAGFARTGQMDRAKDLLDQARPRREENPLEFDLAELAVLARSAPAEDVRKTVDELLGSGKIPTARRWVLLLNLAVALRRQGTPEAGQVLERVILESELCGLPDLPALLEPQLFEEAAAQEGQPDEGSSDPNTDEVAVVLLGRFAVRRGGAEVTFTSAKATQLVKLLATRVGSAPIDLVIDTLWPEVDPAVGRRRLKNVMSRARSDLGDILVRERERIALSSSVAIDLSDFNLAARQAVLLAQTDPAKASEASFRALALYLGELLPDDRYDDWAELARVDVRNRALTLVDIILAEPSVVSSPEKIAAVAEIMLRVDPSDPNRLRDLEARCIEAGNLATARGLRQQMEALS